MTRQKSALISSILPASAMALLGCASVLSLVLPTPVPPPAIVQPSPARGMQNFAADDALLFPATQALAGNVVSVEGGGLFGGPKKEVYKGGLDLDSLLDSVPDSKPKEDPAMARFRERAAEEDAVAKEEYQKVLQAEATGKDLSFAGSTKESANAGIAAAKELFNR